MTNDTYALVYPMLAMFLWTFLIMSRNVQVRVSAVLRGQLSNEYFELFRGSEPSEVILKTGNHLRNLMEMPPLFYIVTLAIMLTQHTDRIFDTGLELLCVPRGPWIGAPDHQQGAPALLVLHTQQCRIVCDVGKARRSTLRGRRASFGLANKYFQPTPQKSAARPKRRVWVGTQDFRGLNFGSQISGDCCSNRTETFMSSFTSSTRQPTTFVIMRGPSSRSTQAMT